MRTKYGKRGLILFIILIILLILSSNSILADVYRPYLHNPIQAYNPGLNNFGIYETGLWTGAATYSYPIEVPPATNGLQPTLFLSYNHQATSQPPSIIGTAWSLNDNYIMRDVDYSVYDTSDDKFKLILNGQSYDLIYDNSDNKFHTEMESYLDIQNFSGGANTNDEYWIATTKDGIQYRLGYNLDSELVSNKYSYTTKWSLDLILDLHNNSIFYSYKENPYSKDESTVYPHKIEYNNDKSKKIEFVLEKIDRTDGWLSYSSGTLKRESRRLQEISIQESGNVVKKYVLNYTLDEPAKQKSFLSFITLFGPDNITKFPPTTFDYYEIVKGWQEDETFVLPSSQVAFVSGSSDFGSRLIDLNRDGLIDIVHADGLNPHINQSWINNGTGWVRNDSWNLPEYIIDDSWDDTGLRFLDFNGDGFTDIVKGDGTERKTWQNSGSGWLPDNAAWHLPEDAHPIDSGSNEYDRGVRFVDVNGDGLVDILRATYNDGRTAWINNGSGWMEDEIWKLPTYYYFFHEGSGEDHGVRLVDLNGDNLPELIEAKTGAPVVRLNNGSGWQAFGGGWYFPREANFVDSDGMDLGVRLVDVNGDGLIDILKSNSTRAQKCWLNNGTGNWVEDLDWNVPERASFVWNDGGNKGVRLVDVNGDGLVDLMNGGNKEVTFINKASKSYLLKNITTSSGNIINIEYIKSTELNNTGTDAISDLGFNLWLVDSIIESNSISGSHNLTSTVHYSYEGGYYNYSEKEFRGFKHVDEILFNLSIIKHWFHQTQALKGIEYLSEVLDQDSKPYQVIESEWKVEEQSDYYINSLMNKTLYLYDGLDEESKITKAQYSYDDYGNVLSIKSLGDNATTNDEKYEYFEYVYNTTAWLVNLPKRYALYDSDNTTKIREIFYKYDNQNYGTDPIKGDLTEETYWLDTETDNLSYSYEYDNYGNVIQNTLPDETITTYSYDDTNTFVNEIVNDLGFIYLFEYDLGTGNLLSETDPNGFVTNYSYDVFGRRC